MKMTIRSSGGHEWKGEHVYTIPGHREMTDVEMEKFFTAKKGTPQYSEIKSACGINRYVLIIDGKYITFPMNGAFKVNLQ